MDHAWSRNEIEAALEVARERVAVFFGGLTKGDLLARSGVSWNAAEHLSHLNTSVAAVARGFAAPRLVLRVRFGRARKPSRPYEELRDHYRGLLAAGGRASGPFIPTSISADAEIADPRPDLLARWERVNGRLLDALGRWSERDLDRLRMPHPLLGMLTPREMLFFTIYHNQHHIDVVKRRLGATAAEEPGRERPGSAPLAG